MHLTKKTKTILAWSIPSAALVVASAIVIPVVVVKENESRDVLNKAKNFEITLNNDQNILPDSMLINPHKFSYKYFALTLMNKDIDFINKSMLLDNSTTDGSQEILGYDPISNSWKVKVNGSDIVSYSVIGVQFLSMKEAQPKEGETNPTSSKVAQWEYTIQKTFNGKRDVYTTVVNADESSFVTDEESQNYFLGLKTPEINDLFINGDLSFVCNNDTVSDVASLQPGMLSLKKSLNPIASSFNQVGSGKYQSSDSSLSYLNQSWINIEVPVEQDGTKIVFNSTDAFQLDPSGNGLCDVNTPLYQFLLKEKGAGHLPYLPKGASEQEQISKLIFNPDTNTPYQYTSDGKKIPLDSLQAILVKVAISEKAYTWVVSWSSIFVKSSSAIDRAPELPVKALKINGVKPTWEQLIDPKNYGSIVVNGNANNPDLVYKTVGVEFAADDTYKTKATVRVQISSKDPQITATREYTVELTTGFKTKAYCDMEAQIDKLIPQGSTSLQPITPTVVAKDPQEVYNAQYDMNQLKEALTITPPAGLTGVEYTPVFAKLDGTTLTIEFTIASVNDKTSPWEFNGSVQEIVVELQNITPPTSNNNSSNGS